MPSLDPNLEKINATISSILSNSADYELILVLQKVSSEKLFAIERCFENDKRLKIVCDDGVGISRARNVGISTSIGSWILLLDDDIYLKPNTIDFLIKNLDTSQLIYYGDAKIIGTEEHYVKYFIKDKDVDFWSYNRVCSISLVFNRIVFNRIGYFDERLGSGTYFGSSEESDLLLRALLKNIKISYIKNYDIYHERPIHPIKKIESYARGGGALYKKFLFCKNVKLYMKFTVDFIIRIIFLLSFKRKRYVFLKGFIQGFFKF
jgi:glycosyltransferase involved in cell wall biosynthesis